MELNEIIKALECYTNFNCDECPIENRDCENFGCIKQALALIKKLTEENERLKVRVLEENHLRHQAEEMLANGMSVVKADTVRKMQERLTAEFRDRVAYTRSYCHDTIDLIAKEMLEDDKMQ